MQQSFIMGFLSRIWKLSWIHENAEIGGSDSFDQVKYLAVGVGGKLVDLEFRLWGQCVTECDLPYEVRVRIWVGVEITHERGTSFQAKVAVPANE